MVISPARVGVSPLASWKYWVRKVLLPYRAMPTPRLATIIRAVVLLLSTRIGTIGCRTFSSVITVATPAMQEADQEQTGLPGDPAVGLAGEGDPEHRQCGDDGDQHGAEVVEVHLVLDGRQMQRLLQQDQGDHGQRDADEEAVAPVEVLGDHAAEQRAGDGADRYHGAHVAAVAATLAGRDDRADDRLGQRGQTTHGHALDGAEGHHRRHALRSPAPIEPATNSTIESWTSSFLLNRSESLPQIGVVTVRASSEDVITQVY